MRIFKITVAAVLGAALAVGVAGCTEASGAGSSSAGGAMSAAASGAVPEAYSGVSRVAGGSASTSSSASGKDRSIIQTGTLDLSAKDPVGAARAIDAIVTGAAGHLDADTEHPGRGASADLTARIPATAFQATLTTIEHEGTVRSLSLHAADVTAQVTDDAVRIGALQASIARLTTLLGRATDTRDLVSIEGALTSRQSDLESLQAQQRGLGDQVSYASLVITIETPAATPVRPRAGTFASGFAAGTAALAATVTWLAVAIGVLAPWVLVLAVVAGIALLARRLVRRRQVVPPSADGAG